MAHQESPSPVYSSRPPATLTDLLHRRAAEQGEDLAFCFLADGETVRDRMTYAGLEREARKIAGLLRAHGACGRPVLLLYPPGLDYVGAFFGCVYAGAIAVPAYPPHRNRNLDRLRAIIGDSGARTVLCTAAVRDSMGRMGDDAVDLRALDWLATDAPGGLEVEPFCDAAATSDRVAFLQYTSGSTSTPRGVILTHGNLCHNAQLITQGFRLSADSVAVFWLPLYHDMGLIGGVLQPMQIGRPSYLMAPATFLASPIRWLKSISNYRARISGAPNFAYDLCVDKITPEQRAGLDLSCWRVAFNGAEPVRADTLKRFADTYVPYGFSAAAIYPCYGLAEATLFVTGGTRAREPVTLTVSRSGLERHIVQTDPPEDDDARRFVSCGQALGGQRVEIVDPETRVPCVPDRPGEIWVSGPSVAQGYWQRPDDSERTFGGRTATGEGPFMRTGDLGFLHDGELYITGRIKDLIILRGRNLYPQDIEQTAEAAHPALRNGCGAAFAVEADGGEQLVYVSEVERSSRSVPAEEVAAAVTRAVAEAHEAGVDAVVLLKPGGIPKTSSGKIQRHACKAGYLAGSLDIIGSWVRPADPVDPAPESTSGAATADEVRSWLIERIARKLRIPAADIDPREPLSRYGLDSLTAVQTAGELEQWLGRTLSPVIAYDYPTIEALAAHLSISGPVESSSAEAAVHGATQASEPIAVVGIGCRFPGADGPDRFWQLLRDGMDAITEVPSDRWNIDDYYSEDGDKPGSMNTRFGGFLKEVDHFDRAFFGISPREAERMDPQQRILLETAWEALEDAGIDPQAGTRSVGVFVGVSSNDYGRLQGDASTLDAYVGTGNALSIAANRISYAFDFRGPSIAVDTACSSSLVAIHLACQSIRRGEADFAVAGGVNLILTPELTVNFTRAGMMSPDGRCKAFDAAANGYVRSEGCGVVVLKPLSKAIADGDPIYAVVRGSAVNQDGRSNGLTAPNRQSQEAVVRAACRDASIRPADIDLVEAHGTGTSLGDPIEALALGNVLGQGRPHDRRAWLGSVKTNIGHLESAAGVAGFIKTCLALKHGEVPPSLHFNEANPHIPFEQLPLRVATQRQPLAGRERPALAGVSSFGFGGTNAHIVLEAVQSTAAEVVAEKSPQLIALSARTPQALRDFARRWLDRAESTQATLTDLAFTAALRRSRHDHRLSVVSKDCRELTEHLKSWLSEDPRAGTSAGRAKRSPRVVWVFNGQGPQWWGMGRRLLGTEPAFSGAVEACDAALRPLLGWSVLDRLRSEDDPAKLEDTDLVQPLLFTLQVGLAAHWRSWGVKPAAVVGHSLGEAAAAYVAGALNLEDAVKVVYHRSRLQHLASGLGKMAAVSLTAEESVAALSQFDGRLALAAINGPKATVWSGDPAALEEAVRPLADKDEFHRLLRGQVAFHSPQMEQFRGELVASLADIAPKSTAVPFYSTVTGTVLDGERLGAEYWGRNLREPVQFLAAADELISAGFDLFLELGPHGVLVEPLHQCLRRRKTPGTVLVSLRRGEDDRTTLLAAAGGLYAEGAELDWTKITSAGRVVPLPTYSWQRERCWYEAPRVGRNGCHHVNGHTKPLTNGHRREPAPEDKWLIRPTWEKIAAPADAPRLFGTWLIIADSARTAERLEALLRERGVAHIASATSGSEFTVGSNGRFQFDLANPTHVRRFVREAAHSPGDVAGVLHISTATAPTGDTMPADVVASVQDRGTVGILHLVQALAANGAAPRFWVITRGAQAVSAGDAPAVAQAPVWGLGRVVAHEHPELRLTLLDLDPTPGQNDLALVISALGMDADENQLAVRDSQLMAARLVFAAEAGHAHPPAIRGDATYLITGGLGGLGLRIAERLVADGARTLVLTGRRGTTAEAASALGALRASGANVFVAKADVADYEQLAAVFADIDERLPPLRGVVHAAGVLDDGIALQQNRDRLWKVLAPKLLGGWHLHALTAGRKLDFFALFSSAASLLGSPGQSNYAAANAALDGLAAFRRARGLPAVSINWGPWAGTGMAARDGKADRLAHAGMGTIDPDRGLGLFGRLLVAPVAQVGVVPVDWDAWRRLNGGRLPPYLTSLAGAEEAVEVAAPRVASALNRAALDGVPRDDWQPVIEGQLLEQAARVLRLAAAALDVEQPLNNVGIDSLMAIELKNRIEADLGVAVPMVKFLEGPSVRDLAGFVCEQMRGGEDKPSTAHVHPEIDVNSLSDDQVDALLSELTAAEKGD
jgi:acyl transferase domain-containing protein/acyl-CoA synthetase (AMP-forming)/AMP-acid ligase II/acyl carrier protein